MASPDETPRPAPDGPPSSGVGYRLRDHAGVFGVLFLIGTEAFLISPLLPTIAADLHSTVRSAAAVVTAYVLAYAVTSPFLGAVSDRYGRRRSVLAGTALFLVGNVVAALAGQLWVLVLARALSGLGAATAGPSIWAHIADSVPAEHRGRAIGTGGGFFAAGQVLGLPLGTFVAAAAGWHATFAVLAAASAVALVALHRQVRPGRPTPAAATAAAAAAVAVTPARGVRQGLAGVFRVWRHPVLGHALAVTVLLSAANLGAYSYLGSELDGRFGLSETQRGWVGLLIGGGSFAGSLLAGRLGDRARRAGGHGTGLVPVWGAVLGTGVVVAALVPHLTVVLAAVLVWFVASGAFGTDQQTLLATAAPGLRATAASWNSSSLYLGTAVGVSLVGAFSVPRHGMAVVGGGLALLAALTAAFLALRLRRTAAAAAPRPEPVPEGQHA